VQSCITESLFHFDYENRKNTWQHVSAKWREEKKKKEEWIKKGEEKEENKDRGGMKGWGKEG